MTEVDDAEALAVAPPPLPEGTAFFASDPAGQRACLALAALTGATRFPVMTNRACGFAPEYGVACRQIDSAEIPKGAQLVVCGTSHPDSSERFELGVLAAAGARGVRTVAFIDHWTNLRLRFETADGGLTLPDEIWVVDAHAAKLCVQANLPRDRLRVVGHPALHHLRRARPTEPQRSALRQKINLGARTILYAPDPLTLRPAARTEVDDPAAIPGHRSEVDDRHRQSPAAGLGEAFDEVIAAGDIADAIVGAGVTVLVRHHPLAPQAARLGVAEAFQRVGADFRESDGALTGAQAACAADVVVGMYSNFLLEARALGRPVIRYLPGDRRDPLGHLSFGRRVTTPATLAEALMAFQSPDYEPSGTTA